jgi:hypothetical protein
MSYNYFILKMLDIKEKTRDRWRKVFVGLISLSLLSCAS